MKDASVFSQQQRCLTTQEHSTGQEGYQDLYQSRKAPARQEPDPASSASKATGRPHVQDNPAHLWSMEAACLISNTGW